MALTLAGRPAMNRVWQLAIVAAAAFPGAALAEWGYNFQHGVTPIAQHIESLHEFIFWICCAIFIGVFGVMFYSLFKHRKSVGHQATQFHENAMVEIVWTVIPSWWIPAFGLKQDAIPGFVRDAWFRVEKPGIYRGQCAELCGKEHGYMPIVVEVKTKDDYAKWVGMQKTKYAATSAASDQPMDLATLVTRGGQVFNANCAACHQANGKGVPGAFPALDGSKIVNGPKADQIAIVLHGKPGTAMPPWSQLSDADIASVITYTRNSWSNKTGEAIEPAEIKAARK